MFNDLKMLIAFVVCFDQLSGAAPTRKLVAKVCDMDLFGEMRWDGIGAYCLSWKQYDTINVKAVVGYLCFPLT